jgi:hypothetical protein
MSFKVFIGFDPREQDAYLVCEATVRRSRQAVDVMPIVLEQMRWAGKYKRVTSMVEGRLWDEISKAPMSTEFAISRFLVPILAGWQGWALFCDCDFMFRGDVADLFDMADERYALMCVKHDHKPEESEKMDGQIQTSYPRKNWSSLMLWNCGHPMHAGQQDRVDRWPGLWLHGLRWLPDELIGALPPEWNWLEQSPKAVHYTRGTPDMPGYEQSAFAEQWRQELVLASGKVRV